jgi:hypothetical protein
LLLSLISLVESSVDTLLPFAPNSSFLLKIRREVYNRGYNGISVDWRLDFAWKSFTFLDRRLPPSLAGGKYEAPGRDFAIVSRSRVKNYLLASAVANISQSRVAYPRKVLSPSANGWSSARAI